MFFMGNFMPFNTMMDIFLPLIGIILFVFNTLQLMLTVHIQVEFVPYHNQLTTIVEAFKIEQKVN